jgi:hypothetical protein
MYAQLYHRHSEKSYIHTNWEMSQDRPNTGWEWHQEAFDIWEMHIGTGSMACWASWWFWRSWFTWIGWLLWPPQLTLARISEWMYSIVVMVVVEVEGMICLLLIDTYSILLNTNLILFNVYSMLFNPYSKLFDTYPMLFNTYSMVLDVTVPTQLIQMSHVTMPPVCMKICPWHRSLAWYLNPFEKLQKSLKIDDNLIK